MYCIYTVYKTNNKPIPTQSLHVSYTYEYLSARPRTCAEWVCNVGKLYLKMKHLQGLEYS